MPHQGGQTHGRGRGGRVSGLIPPPAGTRKIHNNVILHGEGSATGRAPTVPVETTPRPRPFRG